MHYKTGIIEKCKMMVYAGNFQHESFKTLNNFLNYKPILSHQQQRSLSKVSIVLSIFYCILMEIKKKKNKQQKNFGFGGWRARGSLVSGEQLPSGIVSISWVFSIVWKLISIWFYAVNKTIPFFVYGCSNKCRRQHPNHKTWQKWLVHQYPSNE